MTVNSAPSRPQVVTSAEIAARLVAKLDQSMGELLDLLRRETELIKAGKLNVAAELAAEKEEKATVYTRLMLVARDEIQALKAFVPEETQALIRRHELFRSEVQINLAVLDTAKDVAEDLMRTVADEVAKSVAAPTYGRPGLPQRAAGGAASGIAINRNV